MLTGRNTGKEEKGIADGGNRMNEHREADVKVAKHGWGDVSQRLRLPRKVQTRFGAEEPLYSLPGAIGRHAGCRAGE